MKFTSTRLPTSTKAMFMRIRAPLRSPFHFMLMMAWHPRLPKISSFGQSAMASSTRKSLCSRGTWHMYDAAGTNMNRLSPHAGFSDGSRLSTKSLTSSPGNSPLLKASCRMVLCGPSQMFISSWQSMKAEVRVSRVRTPPRRAQNRMGTGWKIASRMRSGASPSAERNLTKSRLCRLCKHAGARCRPCATADMSTALPLSSTMSKQRRSASRGDVSLVLTVLVMAETKFGSPVCARLLYSVNTTLKMSPLPATSCRTTPAWPLRTASSSGRWPLPSVTEMSARAAISTSTTLQCPAYDAMCRGV
mmetsp:Transcript_42370/g.98129  ORF Transcript_42370/g.98129 Transcript_42370/m.98129 type:complete len:304 (-) Transcript_42370:788-1699(-)